VTRRIEVIEVDSEAEGCTRTLRIHVPPGFDRGGRTFPVLVMHDGQNLFAGSPAGEYGTWAVDDAIDREVSQGRLPPWIVVGVDHRGPLRIGDDSPWPDQRMQFEPRAPRYASFVVHELERWIGDHLPATPGAGSRAVMGSSMAGLVSLYIAWRHPLAFSRVGALSPSVMWSDGRLARSWRAPLPGRHRIWVDAGAHERFDGGGFELDYGASVRDFGAHLRALGHGDDELRVEIDPGGGHDEASWGRRFPHALAWLSVGLPMDQPSQR
jgi:enterochelin esterase-like enzyme